MVLRNDAVGNTHGWNPDQVRTLFSVKEPGFTTAATVVVSVTPTGAAGFSGPICAVIYYHVFVGNSDRHFDVTCDRAPPADSEIRYVVLNPPFQRPF
jgi:hypothetical protein